MTTAYARYPGGHDLDRFLGAAVGEDRNGRMVTVVSTLARLGFDPGQVAADLAALSRDAATAQIEAMLEGIYDVPSLLREHGPVAKRLAMLLPERRAAREASPGVFVPSNRWGLPRGVILAIAMALLILLQILLVGMPGTSQ